MIKILFALFLFMMTVSTLQAQSLTGIWSGKISRKAPGYSGVESIEMQINQAGKNLRGYTFAFKDTSRFVLFDMSGTRQKKTQTILIRELGYAYFLLPEGFLPCEKAFSLKYYKIGKTQYLSGTWTGLGNDTSCFPGEELLVVLQKIKKPEYPIEQFVQKKIFNYMQRRLTPSEDIPDPMLPEPALKQINDSLPADRKIDIQQIIQLPDTIATITLYDNAIVDDDTVSVFVDKIPVLQRERISIRPLSFNITIKEPGKPLEILMQAENLGAIPPNTAVMIIETAHKRYEVRLSASFEKHAVIILTYNSE